MTLLSSTRISESLLIARTAATNSEKGRALEDCLCHAFGCVPGVRITHRDQLNIFKSEEIDIALWNDRLRGALDFLPNVILVESKNWSAAVGSQDIAWFDTKLRNRGMDFGIFVAINGITGDPSERTSAHQIIAAALRENRRMVVVVGADLGSLRKTEDLVLMIKMKLCELAVTGTLFP